MRICVQCYLLLSLTLGLSAADRPPVPMADLAITVGEILQDDYYDHSRIKPVLMVERALQALESAEISIDTRWHDDQLFLQMGDEEISWPAPRPLI